MNKKQKKSLWNCLIVINCSALSLVILNPINFAELGAMILLIFCGYKAGNMNYYNIINQDNDIKEVK